MQVSTQPQAAPAPAAATAPVAITTVGPDGKPQTIAVPRTRGQVSELLARRQELSDQLSSVSERRTALSEEIQGTAVEAARVGLQDRLRLLDNRILQLEGDLAIVGRQLSSAPAELIAGTQGGTPQPQSPDTFEDGVFVGGGSALFLAVAAWFMMRRRRRRPGTNRAAGLGEDSSQRLERLEHGMDAIAIEIERISEGQRFVTKLLSESPQSVPSEQRR